MTKYEETSMLKADSLFLIYTVVQSWFGAGLSNLIALGGCYMNHSKVPLRGINEFDLKIFGWSANVL